MNKEKILKKITMTNEDVEKHPFLSKGETKTFYVWLADFLQLKETDRLDCEKVTEQEILLKSGKLLQKKPDFQRNR